MNAPDRLQQSLSFIHAHMGGPLPARAGTTAAPKLAFTLSRQTGSGGRAVAEELAAYLQRRAPVPGIPWTVFDRNLVERVLEDHHLPTRLAQFMPEDRVNELEDTMQELLGTVPSGWKLVGQVTETILKLAELGTTIIVGRGANIITASLDHVFHVRLVGSLERRIQRVMAAERLGYDAAKKRVQGEDRGRKRYLKKYFRTDVGDPLQYHLVINTDRMEPRETAQVIAEAAILRASRA